MFWRRKKQWSTKRYLHVIKYKGVDLLNKDEWEERAEELKKDICEEVEKTLKNFGEVQMQQIREEIAKIQQRGAA